MGILKQSTAITILVGPILDSAGAAKTDEVVENIRLTKNGTVGTANASAQLTHDHAGKYKLALTTSDTDTVGLLEISLNSGTNDMAIQRFNVVETAVYDALFADGAAGYQVPIWTGASATVNLSGTTVKAVTDAVALSQSLPANFSALSITAAGKVTVGTNDDKTGYSLSQAFPSNFSSLAITAAGKVTVGTNDDKTGYSLTQAFPSNFAALGINASGHVSRVTLVDTTTTNTDMITAAGIRTAVGLASANLDTQLADLPTVAEFEARTLVAANYATAANLATVAGYLDTEIAAILADTNELQTDWADGGRLDLILDARASQTSVDTIDDLLDTEIAAIKADTAAILLDTGTDGVVVAAASKTGYSLASTGLDSIAVTAPSGVATTFPGMVVQLWRRFFRKATKTSSQIKTYADDGTTVVTTQTVSDDGTTETQGAAS